LSDQIPGDEPQHGKDGYGKTLRKGRFEDESGMI